MTDERRHDARGRTATRAPASARRKRSVLLFLRDLLIILVAALVISFLIKTFLIRSFYIPSESMEDDAPHQRPHHRERARSRPHADRARRRRRVQGSGRLAPTRSRRPSRNPVAGFVDWLLVVRRPHGARQQRPPHQARHRPARRPRRLLQRLRPDDRQRRAARRAVRQAAARRHEGLARRLRGHRARGLALGDGRQPLQLRGLPLQPRRRRATASCRSTTSSAARS